MAILTTQTVTGVDGEVRELRAVTDSIRSESSMMPNLTRQMEQLMRGVITTMRMDTRGRVLSMAMSGGTIPPQMQAQMSRMTSGALSRMATLPEGPVSVGATWVDPQSVSIPMGPAVTTLTPMTYRLVRLERQSGTTHVVISGTTTFKTSVDTSGNATTTSGDLASEFEYDLTAGRLVRGSWTMKGVMEMPQMGQSIPLRRVQTMELLP